MRHRQSTAKPALNSLHNSEGGASLLHRAEQCLELHKILHAWPALRGVGFEVGPIKQDQLFLYVNHPSAMARIKQSVPSLIEMLHAKGWTIHRVKLKVTTLHLSAEKALPKSAKAGMSQNALSAWKTLQNSLSDPDILAATSRLVERHSK